MSTLYEDFEATLDHLIHNAKLLQELEDASLEDRQERLLDHLFDIHRQIRDEAGIPSPSIYGMLEKKIHRFSDLNWKLLREPRKRHVKKARVHRNRSKPIGCN